MTIKEIKQFLLKRFDKDDNDERKSDANKSFDNVNQVKKSQTLNNSSDNIKDSKRGEIMDTNAKNESNIEKKMITNDNKEVNISINTDINIPIKKGKHKKINIFYKGKELVNDEEKISSLISNNGNEELELSIVILSLNDSTFVDENKTKEKLIQKVTEKCQFHKDNKELYICITCGMAFCTYCANKHETHNIIERKNIIKFNNELKILNEELSKSLTESNFNDIYEINENKIQNNEYSNNFEKLQNRLDNIRKMHKGIINNYKIDLDKSLPYLLEYKEKIEQLIESSYQLDTIKNEQQFMDYYYWYTNIKEKNIKIKQEIEDLQKKKQKFNELLTDFDDKIKNIFIKTDSDYKLLKNLYYNYNNENENQFRNMNLNNTNSQIINNQSRTPKLNLFNLLNQNEVKKDNSKSPNKIDEINSNKDKKDLSSINSWKTISNTSKKNKIKFNDNIHNIHEKNDNRNRKRFFTQRIKSKKLENFEEIEEKTEVEESQEDSTFRFSKKIYNIKPKTQNIYFFDFDKRKVQEITVNFDNLNIGTFEQYHSTLNYRNNFYFSGGYNSSKVFCKYNPNDNIFIKLKEMPTTHSYHGMLGIKNFIFIISGFNSKKVEKYDIIKNDWQNLPELKESRSWPSCLEYKNKYIFVFGGLCHNYINEDNILIEKLDISIDSNKWIQLNYNYNKNIKLPFYFGLVNIDDNSFLLMGGKYNTKENNMNDCYKIIFDEKRIEIEKDEDFKLPQKEEFNGKMFANFGKNYFGEFSSLSYGTFYLVNSLEKKIKEIK